EIAVNFYLPAGAIVLVQSIQRIKQPAEALLDGPVAQSDPPAAIGGVDFVPPETRMSDFDDAVHHFRIAKIRNFLEPLHFVGVSSIARRQPIYGRANSFMLRAKTRLIVNPRINAGLDDAVGENFDFGAAMAQEASRGF